MRKGIDYTGGVNYIDVITEHHPEGFAAGFLCKATGWKNGIRAARALAETGKCPAMRIHGVWHDDHRFSRKDVPKAVRQAEKVAALAEDFPGIRIFFSPWLEYHASRKAWKKVRRSCRAVLPRRVKIVSTPLRRAFPEKGIVEVHHEYAVDGRKYIYSFDGCDMRRVSVSNELQRHSHARVFFAWVSPCNGKSSIDDPTPRHLRKHWLVRNDIRFILGAIKR